VCASSNPRLVWALQLHHCYWQECCVQTGSRHSGTVLRLSKLTEVVCSSPLQLYFVMHLRRCSICVASACWRLQSSDAKTDAPVQQAVDLEHMGVY
jgi:hypothetical protein